jgi:hypothetical protein
MTKNIVSKRLTNHRLLPPVYMKLSWYSGLERNRDSSVGIATGYGLAE